MRTPPRISRMLGMLALGGAAMLFAAACDDTNNDTNSMDIPNTAGTAQGVDRNAILNDLTAVRSLLENAASTFPADVVSNVEYDNQRLVVTVTENVDGIAEAESLCQDLIRGIEATDIEIAVVSTTDQTLATCRSAA